MSEEKSKQHPLLGEIEAGLLEVGELRGPLFQILPHLLVGGWIVLGVGVGGLV